jgi:hypothetical protein
MVDLTLPLAAETDFFTAKALGTFTGASVATVIVSNTVRVLIGKDWRFIPFVVALVFAYAASRIVGDPHTFPDYLLVLLNGCLLFCTAIGANDVLVAQAQPDGIRRQSARRVRWLQSWYPNE